jgi:hypothetical protein
MKLKHVFDQHQADESSKQDMINIMKSGPILRLLKREKHGSSEEVSIRLHLYQAMDHLRKSASGCICIRRYYPRCQSCWPRLPKTTQPQRDQARALCAVHTRHSTLAPHTEHWPGGRRDATCERLRAASGAHRIGYEAGRCEAEVRTGPLADRISKQSVVGKGYRAG